jgi:hypothetical protein
MDTTSTKQQLKQKQTQQHLKHHYTPLLSLTSSTNSNPFSILLIWVSKSLKSFCFKLHFSNGFCLKTIQYHGMVISTMEDLSLSLAEKKELVEENVGCDNGVVGKRGTFSDLIEEKGFCESSSSSEFLSSENIGNEEQHSHSSSTTEEGLSSPLSLRWNVQKISTSDCSSPHGSEDGKKKHLVEKEFVNKVSALTGIYILISNISYFLMLTFFFCDLILIVICRD